LLLARVLGRIEALLGIERASFEPVRFRIFRWRTDLRFDGTRIAAVRAGIALLLERRARHRRARGQRANKKDESYVHGARRETSRSPHSQPDNKRKSPEKFEPI
jgi:hypothetical protein